MKTWLSISGWDGCGFYRAVYPGEAAKAEGAEVSYIETLRLTLRQTHTGPKVVGVGQEMDCDVFVISRPLRRFNMESVRVIQKAGIAVVVDIDDDFTAVDPRHYFWKRFQPQFNAESNRDHLLKACAHADLVTCTTPALAKRYAPHGRVAVLPNRIPQTMLGTLPEKPRDGRTVGWSGFVGTHPMDLQATRGGVGAACREIGARFLNVGTGEKVQHHLELGEAEFEATGSKEFADYPYALARFDVGIAPLDDTAFNQAKSALKGLEMAAVGVPFVASPNPDYLRIADDGIGLLAMPKAKHWKRAVLELMAHREEYGAEMRERVKANHLYEGNGWRWLEAWEAAIANRKRSLKGPTARV